MNKVRNWEGISHDESAQIRALAIFAILLHNFMHWLTNSPGENEYQFEIYRRDGFLDQIKAMPWDSVRLISTYFGHYGVQIFFFLSGYGLAARYGKNVPSWGSFVKRRLIAFYIPITLAVAGMFIYQYMRGSSTDLAQLKSLGYQLTGISNFMPGNAVWAPIGPWWFIGVILHFYLLAPFLLQLAKRFGCWVYLVIIGLGLGSDIWLNQDMIDEYKWSINFCLLGHFDTIGLGMLAAHCGHRQWKIAQSWWWVIAWLALFIRASLHEPLWEISGLACVLGGIPALRWIISQLAKVNWMGAGLSYLGSLSMFIFLCHGYLRQPLVPIANERGGILWAFACFAAFIVLTLVWAATTRAIHRGLVKLLRIPH